MKTPIHYTVVNTKDILINQAIQELAKKSGFTWITGIKIPYITEGMKVLCFENKHIYHSNSLDSCKDTADYKYTILTIEETITYLRSQLPKKIKIGSYEVVFNENEIQVGCQTISKDKVKEIWERLQ